MTITQATQNKGRSASFVAFWGSEIGTSFNTQRLPPPFCTYRPNGKNEYQPLPHKKLSDSPTNAALGSIGTELSKDPHNGVACSSSLLYVQKMLCAPASAADLDYIQAPFASPSGIAIHFCTYRTPTTHEYRPSEIMGEISEPFLRALHFIISSRPTPRGVDGSTSVRTEAERLGARITRGLPGCANSNCQQSSAKKTVQPALVLTAPRLQGHKSNVSLWTRADVICKSNLQITTFPIDICACSISQWSVEWRSMRTPENAVLASTTELATAIRTASATDLSAPLYVQNSHRPTKASVHTERHSRPVDWSLASVSSPLYVQIMRRHSQGSVRTERPGSLNTNAHWQGNLHSTVGIVISDIHRARFPLQRIHRLTRSKTRIAKQNPAMSGVLCIWGTWNWRLKMT